MSREGHYGGSCRHSHTFLRYKLAQKIAPHGMKHRSNRIIKQSSILFTPIGLSGPVSEMRHRQRAVYEKSPLNSHRIIECFGLEGTFRDHLAQPPCTEQGHLQLDQVAQSPVQPGLECFQGWDPHCLSEQPVPVFHHPYRKKFLPYT